MLGFGDIILPGILATLGLRFDLHRPPAASVAGQALARWRYPLFLLCLAAYAVGLVICYGVMSVMQSPQPALLYLVPW